MIYIHPYNDADTRLVVPEDEKWFITHEQNGDDVLQFELDHGAPYVDELVEETYVRAEGQVYVVKTIEDKSDFIVYTCEINKDDFKQSVIEEYLLTSGATTGVTLATHLNKVMTYVANGWTYSGDYAEFTDPILICDRVEETRDDEGGSTGQLQAQPLKRVTPLEILDKLSEACGCMFNFDTKNKVLQVVNLNSSKRVKPEVYFTDELNVIAVEYVGTSTDIVTRMYGVGKEEYEQRTETQRTVLDPETKKEKVIRETQTKVIPTVTFKSVNGGRAYVDDFSYTDKIISAWYVNEDCTDAQQLLKETKAALAQACQPKRSYSVKLDNGQMKDANMYDVVWVVDSQRDIRLQHQIVSYKEYPAAHYLDEMTLSQEPVSISKLFKDMEHHIEYEFDNTKYTMEQYYLEQVRRATDMITGSTGGTFLWITDGERHLRELVNLGDSDSIDKAKQVWRWNEAGLGHSSNGYNGPYDLALLKDGSINASMITTGTLNAVRIRAGTLQDLNGYNYWNLETGEFRLRAASTMVGSQTLGNYIDSQIPSYTDSFSTATAQQVFNKMTNNGVIKGITMSGNYLYINASYINTGTISDYYGYNYWNLNTGEFRLSANTKVGTSSSSKSLSSYIDGRIPSYTDSFSTATAQQVFNKLTNNGAIQGITMSGNALYINASYINSGTLSGNYIKGGIIGAIDTTSGSTWNLSTGEFKTHGRMSIGGQYHDLYLYFRYSGLDFLMDSTVIGRIMMQTSSDPNWHALGVGSYSDLILGSNNTINVSTIGPSVSTGTAALSSGYLYFLNKVARTSTSNTVNARTYTFSTGYIRVMKGLVISGYNADSGGGLSIGSL